MSQVCSITDITDKGYGVTRLDGEVIFVEGALPGDRVILKDINREQKVTHARVASWDYLSPDRVNPFCPHAWDCDGCPLQALSLEAQARIKSNHIQNAFERISGLPLDKVDFVEADEIKHYRNKITLKVVDFQLGYYSRRTNCHIPIETCPIASSEIDASIPLLNTLLKEIKPQTLTQIVLRSGQKGVMLIMEAESLDKALLGFGKASWKSHAFISIYAITGKGRKRRAEFLYGDVYLEDQIGDLVFQISPDAFFQVNRFQTIKLYETALSLLPQKHYPVVLDLYCGIGTITLYAASLADQITGVEINSNAIKDAKRNAGLNDIAHARFKCLKSEEATALLKSKPDLLIVDPPRNGLEKTLIEAICNYQIQTILYISCNPATLARDVKRFVDRDYRVKDPIGVDMFVHSLHVETVTLLERK